MLSLCWACVLPAEVDFHRKTQNLPAFLPGLYRLPLSAHSLGSSPTEVSTLLKGEDISSQTTDGYWWPPPLEHLSLEIPLGLHPFDIVSSVPQPYNLSQGALEATFLTSRNGQPTGGAGDGCLHCRWWCGNGVPGHQGGSSVGSCSYIFCPPFPTECPKMPDMSMSHF